MNILRGSRARTMVVVLTLSVLAFALARASGRGVLERRDIAQAIEISPANTDLLPRGKEADGIIGDFLLRNAHVQALVSANRAGRKANYATERGFVTPGSLYDLDVAGADNDQLTILRPAGLGAEVSWVRIVDSGAGGAAVVETVRTAAIGDAVIQQFRDELIDEVREKRLVGPDDPLDDRALLLIDPAELNSPFAEKQRYLETVPPGIFVRHEYRLEPGWHHLVITSTFRNESTVRARVQLSPIWKAFSREWTLGPVQLGESIDPADRRAYGWAALDMNPSGGLSMSARRDEHAELLPGEERTHTIAVVVADSPLAVYGVLAGLAQPTGRVLGSAIDTAGGAVGHGTVQVDVDGQTLSALLKPDGTFAFNLPLGTYSARLVDIGREPQHAQLHVTGGEARLTFAPPPASAVQIDIDEAGAGPVPCGVEFVGLRGTVVPNLGPRQRARGCDNRYYSSTGHLTQQLPPGSYLVRVMRGPEYDTFEQEIEVQAEATVRVGVTLKRVVDTTGWVSTDYHVHSTASGDNDTSAEDRIINLAAEHIELAPATEHNRIEDWAPHVARLGLERYLMSVPGIELTRSGENHLNAFPLVPRPFTQDNGAPAWHPDPRMSALALRALFRDASEGWVHLNHPVIGTVFNDRNRDRVADGGYEGIDHVIDGMESWSTEILNPDIWYDRPRSDGVERRENRTFGWLQLLNQGRRAWSIAVSDAHNVCDGAGVWRTYVKGTAENPASIDVAEIIRNSKAGRMMITNGPFLTVETADGLPIGSTVRAPGFVDLEIRVQAANWIDIDRVQVLINGRQDPAYRYTRRTHPGMFGDGVMKFDRRVRVALEADAHLIVVATSDSVPASAAWEANRAHGMRPMAYTNPIFVDFDGNGFEANGETLGHPLLVTPEFRQRY